MKRIFRGLVLLCVSGTAIAAQTLRSRYGKPVSETFLIRPGIGATATYGPKGQVIEWVVSAWNPALVKSRNSTLTREAVADVLDELAPPRLRGKPVSSSIRNVTCPPANDCGGSEQVFQHVTIYYNPGPSGFRYVVVQWRK